MAAILAFFIFSTLFSSLPHQSSAKSSFKVDLIHPDSPLSPFYQPSTTFEHRANQAILNSKSRLQYFQSIINPISTDAIQATVSPAGAFFTMQLSLGTPPVKISAILDTGGDLIWTQCLPCVDCYEQQTPIFNPQKSSTYRNLSCNSTLCEALGEPETCDSGCQYSYTYADKSYTNGVLATETLTFDSSGGRAIKLPKMGFGCGHDNGGNFGNNTAGLVGLGGGQLSLISQLGSSVESKFSYCLGVLLDPSSTSFLKFGEDADLPGDKVTTPRTKVGRFDTFYHLTLEDISVGSKKLNIPPGTFHMSSTGTGGLIIDSGTTMTFLQTKGYNMLVSALKDAISLSPVDSPAEEFQLCYDTLEAGGSGVIPDVTFHFSGADVVLKPLNTFFPVSKSVTCLNMIPDESMSVFGNLAQQNHIVGYNLADDTVSFAPADCSKLK